MNAKTKPIKLDEIKPKAQIYASFYLSDIEFAIPVEKITEVLNAPDHYTQIPLSPPYLKGIITTLSGVVPIIDLRTIFKLEEHELQSSAKIAIIEYGRYFIGILFDKTGQVFKPLDKEISYFEKNNTSEEATKIISGVLKKDDGKRMIQLLDLEEVFKLEHIPFEAHDEESRNNVSHLRLMNKGERRQCISFLVGHSRCALDIESIYEIVKIDEIKKTVISSNYCIGMIDLRGITVPIINFASFLHCTSIANEDNPVQESKIAIVMKLDQELFGLIIDQVVNIITFYSGDLIKFPQVTASHSGIIAGCIVDKNNSETILLDHHHILSNNEIIDITQGHNKIYSVSEDNRMAALTTGDYDHIKKSYISFTIEKPFAVAIGNVSEIIDSLDNLIYPPELPPHIKGIFNLRGKLIPVINTRLLYNLSSPPAEDSKIIILNAHESGAEFGLIVDSVNSIIHFSEREKMIVPHFSSKKATSGLNEDILEAVEIDIGESQKLNLLILNSNAIYARIMGCEAK